MNRVLEVELPEAKIRVRLVRAYWELDHSEPELTREQETEFLATLNELWFQTPTNGGGPFPTVQAHVEAFAKSVPGVKVLRNDPPKKRPKATGNVY